MRSTLSFEAELAADDFAVTLQNGAITAIWAIIDLILFLTIVSAGCYETLSVAKLALPFSSQPACEYIAAHVVCLLTGLRQSPRIELATR